MVVSFSDDAMRSASFGHRLFGLLDGGLDR
jgi:hypothetical protein